MLDNAATVEEAIGLLDGVQFLMAEAHGRPTTVHLAVEDATGDSAVIEYIDGKMRAHHGRGFTVMTNDPPLRGATRALARAGLFESVQ